MGLSPLLIHGMHGLGDNIHQRAVVRQLMQRHDVWLESSWVALYHDLIAEGLKVIRKPARLRTQEKNAAREAAGFSTAPIPPRTPSLMISYSGHQVAAQPSRTVLEAMCRLTGTSYADADFRLPIPAAWYEPVDRMIAEWAPTLPILVYRQPTVRTEWRGNEKRNPDLTAYRDLIASIRNRFFVVSIGDVAPSREWMVGQGLKADATFHKGELPFESLAALFSRAAVVFTPSGFGAILAPAVETPVVSVIGLYESGQHHGAGERFAPYLAIEPITPCICQNSGCSRVCSKAIDMPTALTNLTTFVTQLGHVWHREPPIPALDMFEPLPVPGPATPFHMRPHRSPQQLIEERQLRVAMSQSRQAYYEALQKMGLKA